MSSPNWSSTTKRMVATGLVAGAVFVLYLARGAIGIVALAAVLAFLLAPLVRLLHRRARLPRPVALLATYALLMVAFLLVGTVVAAGVANSVTEIDPPTAVDRLRDNAVDILEELEVVVLFGYEFDLGELVNPLRDRLVEAAEATTTEPATDTDDEGPPTVTLNRESALFLFGNALTSLRTVGAVVVAVVLSTIVTLLIALYLNLDSQRFHRALHRYAPDAYIDDMERLGDEITGIWRGYMYGQIANSLATGLLVWIALALVGLPGSFVLGVIMALLNMIPTFGPIIAAVPGVLSAFALGSTRFDMSNLGFAVVVGIIYLVVVQAQANVMAPFITGRSVRMSPAAILVGLIVGVQVAGLIGAVLVVPVMASGKTLVRYAMAKLVDHDPFETDSLTPSG